MSTKSENTKGKRWHDNRPQVTKSLRIIESFPKEIRHIIADGICTIAEKEFEANELIRSFKSMGREKVLALYKSKNKRRSYDKDPVLHKTFNYLFILSEENQDFMAHKVLELTDLIYDYLKSCQEFYVPPEKEDIATITTYYVESGAEEVNKFLTSLKEEFKKRVSEGTNQPNSQFITESSHSMRIKSDGR